MPPIHPNPISDFEFRISAHPPLDKNEMGSNIWMHRASSIEYQAGPVVTQNSKLRTQNSPDGRAAFLTPNSLLEVTERLQSLPFAFAENHLSGLAERSKRLEQLERVLSVLLQALAEHTRLFGILASAV